MESKVLFRFYFIPFRFFDKDNLVARSWMDKNLIVKMNDPQEPPKPPVFKNDTIKKRYSHATSMAIDAVNLSKIERIDKYSFASLYTMCLTLPPKMSFQYRYIQTYRAD